MLLIMHTLSFLIQYKMQTKIKQHIKIYINNDLLVDEIFNMLNHPNNTLEL